MIDLKLSNLYDRMAFCDPSGGKSAIKKTLARSAIVVTAHDALDRIFVLFAWADRVPTDTLIDKIFWVNKTFIPRNFGVEANGLQSLFGDGIRREARLKGVRIPLLGIMQPTRLDKNFRNRACLQPVIADGRLFMQAKQHELREELAVHPMSPTFDLVDALASSISMMPKRAFVSVADDEEVSLARYLRKSGAPPWHIEQRLNEYRQRKSARTQ